MRKLVPFWVVLCLCLLTEFAVGQGVVSGKVIGADDAPIPFATVQIKGAKLGGVAADANGSFKITANAGQTLVVSAVGFETREVLLGSSGNIRVTLSATSESLGDVIVTGVAGRTSRKKLTVSVTKVNAEQLQIAPATSVSSSLMGKVAGLKAGNYSGNPGDATQMLLRGDNNLNTSSAPLYLVDGVILNGGIADLNVDDVESIEVVKGAAASALYGSRSGNGVISIITKRGKGLPPGKPVITVRNEIGIQRLAKELATSNAHIYELASDWETYKGQYTKYAGVTYPAGYMGAGYNLGVAGNRRVDADGYMDNPYGKYIDAQDQFFRTGINYTNYVSVASRHEKGNVFLSFENNAQEGVVDMFDGYKRQNFRLNIDQQVTSWLKLSASNLFINKTTNTPGSSSGIFYAIARQEKDVDLKNQTNPDGQLYYLKSNQFNTEATNPLYAISRQKTKGKTRRWIANYTANFKFTPWADLDVTQTLEIENYRYSSVTPKDFWVQSGGTAATNGMSYNNGSMSQNTSETNTKNTQATLNLNKKFNNLGVHGKLSYLYEDRHYEYNALSASGFVISGIEQFNNFTNISGGSSNTTNERAQNYFAILGLDWKDRYLFDGMFRYDGSSLFGADARWNPYYRVSGAYRISEDLKINGIDELKIRAAYGTAGNRPGFSWQYETYNLSSGTATPSQKGNTLLKPTTTKETEVGLNVEFLKKFRAEVTYASSSTVDQFLNVPLVAFLNGGFTSQWQNAGTVKSNTFELTLGADWIRKKDFSWTTNITFSKVRQKITELPIAPYWSTDNSNGDQDIYRIQQGEVYGAIYGHRMLRSLDEMALQLPAGKTIADYEINSEGYVIPKGTQGTTAELPVTKKNADGSVWFDKIGDGNPDFIAGITNTLTFKGFQLYILLDWKQGGDVYNGKDQRLAFNNVSAKQDMSNVPAGQKKAASYWASGMYDANFANSYWVEDGTYLKVREVALGYSVPAKALSRVFKGAIKGINAKLIGRNLLTFTNYSGYDPEVGSLRSPFDGIYANPVYRNIAFSLSFNF